MGAIEARNRLIDDALINYKGCHDRHFPVGRGLTDSEWEEYIAEMDIIAATYRDSNISELSGKLCMAFLDDVEYVDKKWKEKLNKKDET